MSKNQRFALVAVALVVAVIAFVIARPGSDDTSGTSSTDAAQTAPSVNGTTAAEQTPQPVVERIDVVGNAVPGGAKTITVKKGDRVRIVVTADAPDQFHLHGYDIEKEAKPGAPARFAFTANLEGVFKLESHTAEDAGLPPDVATLVVEPS
jgi:FtsP/CotA-like multicopper oxidase with cupredoxin domain